MKTTTLLAAAAGMLLFAAPAAAQEVASSTKGFFLGVHANGSSLASDDFYGDDDARSGGGLGLQLGWGFTPRLALFTEFTAAGLDDDNGGTVAFGHFDLGLRYAWTSPTRRWVPSVEAAITGRALAQDDVELEGGETGDVSVSGGGFTLGGGIQYFATPKLAIGASVKWTAGEFSRVQVDNVTVDGFDFDGRSTRFNVGVTWYPRGGR